MNKLAPAPVEAPPDTIAKAVEAVRPGKCIADVAREFGVEYGDLKDEVIARALGDLDSGMSIRQIADARGIAKSSIHEWMLSIGAARYDSIKTRGLVRRFVEAQESLEAATSHIEIAKYDRVCKYRAFELERRVRSFAPKQEVTGAGGGPIVLDDLERARRLVFLQNVVDVEPVVAESPEQRLAGMLAGASPALLESAYAQRIREHRNVVDRINDGEIPDLPGASR
jgi:hypothetical protein